MSFDHFRFVWTWFMTSYIMATEAYVVAVRRERSGSLVADFVMCFYSQFSVVRFTAMCCSRGKLVVYVHSRSHH